MWVPHESKDPILLHAPTRKSIACFGAELEHRRARAHVLQGLQPRDFQRFLKQLLPHRRRCRRMILVLDNARDHHALLLRPFLHQHAAHLRFLFLPPYGQQPASIERLWKLTRRLATHNRYFATLAEVLEALNACFNRRRRPNAVLRRLCCIT